MLRPFRLLPSFLIAAAFMLPPATPAANPAFNFVSTLDADTSVRPLRSSTTWA